MKRFLATTAIVTSVATTGFAAAHLSADMATSGLSANEVIGSYVYATESDYEQGYVAPADTNTEWDNIGEIEDIVFNLDGSVQGVVIGVGGFLGLGERDVLVGLDQLRMVTEDDDPDEQFIVVSATKDTLTAMPAYPPEDDMDADMTETEADMADTETPEVAAVPMTMEDSPARMMAPEGTTAVEYSDLTAEMIDGAPVHSETDEVIGEVSAILLKEDGTVKSLVLDVGGFLGMGEHVVELPLDKLAIVRRDDGDDVHIYVNATEEELEAMPEYED